MALIGFSGFDQADMAVASDGSSPVDGTGATTLGVPSLAAQYVFAAKILTGVTGAITGVVSDTSQAFSGYPRQPLVIQSDSTLDASTFTPSFYFGQIMTPAATSGDSSGDYGVRLRFSASDKATFTDAFVPVLGLYRYHSTSIVGPGIFLTYNPSTQALGLGSSATPTVTMPVPFGTEIYVELSPATGGLANPSVYINGTLFGSAPMSDGSYYGYVGVGGTAFVTGSSDWFRISVGDIYYGTAISPMGSVMVPYLEYDTVTTTGVTTPSTSTPLQALTDDDDDTYVSSNSTASSTLTASFTKVPDGFDYKPIAMASVYRMNRNAGYASTSLGLTQSTASASLGTALNISAVAADVTTVVSAAPLSDSVHSDVGTFKSVLTLNPN